MNKITLMFAVAAALMGCAGKPAPPAWKSNAADALKSYSEAYLKGNSGIAESAFARARAELASTGRPDLVAHAELVRCATRVAALEYDACPGFEALAGDATAAERAYAAYLSGRWEGLNPALLPEQHQAVVRTGAVSAAGNPAAVSTSVLGTSIAVGNASAHLAGINDPLSRLVAAGALMQVGRIAPADMVVATETASSQGWRRPLLMWLGVALQRANAAGDAAEAARIQRRIDLVLPAITD